MKKEDNSYNLYRSTSETSLEIKIEAITSPSAEVNALAAMAQQAV